MKKDSHHIARHRAPRTSRTKLLVGLGILALLIIVVSSVFIGLRAEQGTAAARISYLGEELQINESTLTEMEAMALQNNLTLNRSFVIERLAQLEVLKAEARRLGIAPTAEQVEAALASQVASLDAQGLDAALAAEGLERAGFIEGLRSSIVQDLTLRMLFESQVVSQVAISDEAVQAAYDANPSQFMVPEQVSVKHILVCFEGTLLCESNLTQEGASQIINGIYAALSQNASFESLAQQYSTDAYSAANGGDLGTLTRGQTVPEFESVAFNLPVGMISQPFETRYGYHLVAVYAKQVAQQLSFPQVYEELKRQMVLEEATRLQQTYVENLMRQATIVIVE